MQRALKLRHARPEAVNLHIAPPKFGGEVGEGQDGAHQNGTGSIHCSHPCA